MIVIPSRAVEVLVFRSKIDRWLLAVLLAAALGCCVAAVAAVAATTGPGRYYIAAALLGSVAFNVWLLASTTYTVTDQVLVVRSGPFAWRVPIANIRRVTSTRNPLSSPALSLDRLRIDYGDGRAIMISPLDRVGFMAAIEARKAGR